MENLRRKSKSSGMKLSSAPPEQLPRGEKVVTWIAELTGQPLTLVQSRLREEFLRPGINVARALRRAGLGPHVWNDGLSHFYEQSDAFLYELVIWNWNQIKRQIRFWLARHFANGQGRILDVLNIGDGLGFDSAYLSQAGHRVTYFGSPGLEESFARRLFAEYGNDVEIVTAQRDVPEGGYDAAVCLDVLEHVPDPSRLVQQLAGYLRPGGRLFVHAPFYAIFPHNPTHLRANRRYSGSLWFYERHNLALVDGQLGWNPLVLQKGGNGRPLRGWFNPKLLALRVVGLYWHLGRLTDLPFRWVYPYLRRREQWLD